MQERKSDEVSRRQVLQRLAAVGSGIACAASGAAGPSSGVRADDVSAAPPAPTPPVWQEDYSAALDAARKRRGQLLLCFHDAEHAEPWAALRAACLSDGELSQRLSDGWVLLSLPVDAKVKDGDGQTVLLDHPSMADMVGRPGLAILDYRDESAEYFGRVVSVVPLGKEGARYRPAPKPGRVGDDWIVPRYELATLLSLPAGTLTQRTLIFAVRVHAEAPQSASGEFHPVLAQETRDHSQHQARIGVQGHHGWERRFHLINARLPRGLVATEVCAESWGGQSLLESARECVNSWRQSSGHWNQVRQRHPVFGYDMKRGANGVWYATGIFGQGR